MDTPPITLSPAPPAPSRLDEMVAKAKELEAGFLAEMLAHSGLGEVTGPFGGGSGAEQFSSFLRAEQARLIVEKGGIGLAEMIFNSMVKAEMSTRLEALLDQTRDALIAGDIQPLAEATRQMEDMVATLSRLDRKTADRLCRKAERNARLLQAAMRGLRAARQRLAEISSGSSIATYDANGRREVLPSVAGPVGRRV